MGVVTDLLKGAGEGLLNGASKIITDFVADPTKKAEAEAQLAVLKLTHDEEMAKIANQADEFAQQNLTDRNSADMKSDSWMSKNIRPLMLIYLAVTTTIICVLDSCKVLTVSAAWITLLTSAFLSALGYYFVGRTVEKGIAIKNN